MRGTWGTRRAGAGAAVCRRHDWDLRLVTGGGVTSPVPKSEGPGALSCGLERAWRSGPTSQSTHPACVVQSIRDRSPETGLSLDTCGAAEGACVCLRAACPFGSRGLLLYLLGAFPGLRPSLTPRAPSWANLLLPLRGAGGMLARCSPVPLVEVRVPGPQMRGTWGTRRAGSGAAVCRRHDGDLRLVTGGGVTSPVPKSEGPGAHGRRHDGDLRLVRGGGGNLPGPQRRGTGGTRHPAELGGLIDAGGCMAITHRLRLEEKDKLAGPESCGPVQALAGRIAPPCARCFCCCCCA